MLQQLDRVDNVRRNVTVRISQKRKSEFGQFMTPYTIARFMASLFPPSALQTCVLLDAGAGVGAPSCAFLDRWALPTDFHFREEVGAYEIDSTLRNHLAEAFAGYAKRLSASYRVFSDDFIETAALESIAPQRLAHAI